MKTLIDTHVFLWWLFNDKRLCTTARKIISNPDNIILLSSASAWEISTKFRIGKIPEAKTIVNNFTSVMEKSRIHELPISMTHALKAGALNIRHRDPFDRMIMAQAELEDIPVITYDKAFAAGHLNIIPGF